MAAQLSVYVVSDATGATAEAVVTSVLVQFGKAPAALHRRPFTRTVEQVAEIVDEAPAGEAIIVFTFVSRDLSKAMQDLGGARGLVVIDLLGPMIELFADAFHSTPSGKPGVFRGQSDELYKVTEAIHYTLRHDDGQRLETVHEADLVILGVSRTGKTPTSIYLSCRKLKVANIPIVNDVPLAIEAVRAPAPKVGFRIELERLVTLRGERTGRFRERSIPGYSDRRTIEREIEHCEEIYRSIRGLYTINVTDRSIEEISDWITHNVL